MRILLIDDVQFERMHLEMRLKKSGHTVEAVGSGAEALDRYQDFDPELVLLDITMPDMDGFEVSVHIRERFPEWVPIIFLSAHHEPEMIERAIFAGGDDYLIKPVDKLVLNSKLVAMQRIANMRQTLKNTTSKLEEANKKLQQQANEDGLTHLFNRRYIDHVLEGMIAWHGRQSMTMALFMLDVDFFKPFNDNYGHLEGDRCLQVIAKTLKETFSRSGEFVGRYGGEEFIVLLAGVSAEEATHQAERIQSVINALAYKHEFSQVAKHITVSQGVYISRPRGHETPSEFYARADSALYKSKENGRNTYSILEEV